MSPYLSGILLSYAVCLVGLMSPGPNILSVIGTSMGVGRKAGISLAFGVATGSLLWGLSTSAGLTALLAAHASVLTLIKIAGGLYLLWLSFKAWRAAASANELQTMRTAGLSVAGHLLYALAFSTRRMVMLYGRARRWIEAALGAFFCFAGLKLLTSRI